jgi:hypothetical protein
VAAPKLGSQAQYGLWKTPLDAKGGRWICVDRTTKSGPCDRLFVDSNGNGRLDDESPLKATRRDEYMAYFDPVRIAFKSEDGPISYHLICRFYQFGTNRAQLLVGSGGMYQGKVSLGGKKHTVQIIDNTVNGVYNDISENPYDSDRIVLDEKENTSRYLGRWLEVDKELFQIEVAPDGAFIKVQPALNVAMGQVRVPETISEFIAVGTNGHFVRKPIKGDVALPVGGYRVHGWTMDRKDAQGANWQLQGYSFGALARFTVSSSKPQMVNVGEPINAVLQATPLAKNEISFSLRQQGNFGESLQVMKGQEQAPAPQLHVASLDRSFGTTNNFQYG